jgi:hypothetical protein
MQRKYKRHTSSAWAFSSVAVEPIYMEQALVWPGQLDVELHLMIGRGPLRAIRIQVTNCTVVPYLYSRYTVATGRNGRMIYSTPSQMALRVIGDGHEDLSSSWYKAGYSD